MARATGRPVTRSHTTVVSRWFAIPIAARSSVDSPAWCNASGTTRAVLRQISSASCSTQPGSGKCWRCSCCAIETMRPAWSNNRQRVEVVPWSIAATTRSLTDLPPIGWTPLARS
jgi:hypothetical protein